MDGLSTAQIIVSKRSLLEAFEAAHAFDGSEDALNRLIDPLSTFEDISGTMHELGYETKAEAERALTIAIMNGEEPEARTVSEVLDIAAQYYDRGAKEPEVIVTRSSAEVIPSI